MKQFLLAIAWVLWATATAYGDGGRMLFHQDSGAFTVTLYASPAPLRVGRAEISVVVQDRRSGEVLPDPAIEVALESGGSVPLSHGRATLTFSRAGQWKMGITVRRGSDVIALLTECTVEADHSRARLVWFYCLLPVAAIVLFVIHQTLKMRHLR